MKPISDKWIADVIEYGYNPRLIQDSSVTIRKLARELQRVREEIRDHREMQCENGTNYSRASDRVLYQATLPEGER